MTPQEFVAKWRPAEVKESAGYAEHFIDVCRLIGHPTPVEADPKAEWFTLQKENKKASGKLGFADVWLKDKFGWEYKSKDRDLDKAYQQLLQYHGNLANPPLLIVSDFDRIVVRTKFTGLVTATYEVTFDHLLDSGLKVSGSKFSGMQVLKACFENPELLKPGKTTEDLTKEAAKRFGEIADDLRLAPYKNKDEAVARFLTRVLFCMFASDVGLLPERIITQIYKANEKSYRDFKTSLSELFVKMSAGGSFGTHKVLQFNGGLFDSKVEDLEVHGGTMHAFMEADRLNWADVEPSVFGTLFERILNPAKRSQLGAHYTSRQDIELIVEPVLMWPLNKEWDALNVSLSEAKDPVLIRKRLQDFIDRLGRVTVLDPACGSGNFLYVSLAKLKGLEQKVISFGADWGVTGLKPKVHPRQLFGIEIDPYAHELASIVVWIGYLQWKLQNGIPFENEIPILQPLDNVKQMDAILVPSPFQGEGQGVGATSEASSNGKTSPSPQSSPAGRGGAREPKWPEVDVIVGNPPFLGGKKLRTGLGDTYVDQLFQVYDGRVRREADICCYWHEKARAAVEKGKSPLPAGEGEGEGEAKPQRVRVGLLATQAIRGGANRDTLKRIKETGGIFFAESDRKWILDGAAVRVSMVGFDDGSEKRRMLDGEDVGGIASNLTSENGLTNVTQARRLKENMRTSFMGDTKGGPFDIPAVLAHEMLEKPNPHGKSNRDVVRPYVNGRDITGRKRNYWIIDFGINMPEEEAAKYEAPFEYVGQRVRPERMDNARKVYRDRWWLHVEPREGFRAATSELKRYVGTSMVAKHRFYVWLPASVLPANVVIAFARDDDYFFGVLHSRLHEVWALAMGTQLESRPRYTPTTTFETFPFPKPDEKQKAAIAAAAKELNEQRETRLNPPDGSLSTKDLNKRTLTNLYNQKPTWLVNAHKKLDKSVFAAYGWPDDLSDEDILARLLELNLQREPA